MTLRDRRVNRSGIELQPLYTPADWSSERHAEDVGDPGEWPLTRGIYPTMHRGRPWSQRQLVGLATPTQYNQRVRRMLEAGVSAISLIPCNSFYRGHDIDEVDVELLGTCGTTIANVEDMATCFEGIPFERLSLGLNDPSPFTMLAFVIALARRRGRVPGDLTGTSNQSDYISHFVANHMFYRLSLPGARRVLRDHVTYAARHLPRWNPVSVVGQHMQQAGATPAEAMGFALATALQYARDLLDLGLDPDAFLPRFTFFFDVSISFFEEIAKFRAGRRIWARLSRERLGARDPRSWRLKFHAQTSGADLTRQQPLNNLSRVTLQALAGILGGLQSLHTDGYDEAYGTPNEEAARIAIATQNILREEAGLADVIDPLGGSYYVESLTDQMEQAISAVVDAVEGAGGMYAAVEQGLVQRRIGASALAFQARVERGEQIIVGENAYQPEETAPMAAGVEPPDREAVEAQLRRFATFKAERSSTAVRQALDALAAAANDPRSNVFEQVVEAADANVTHGEICACLRRELGFGQPLIRP